MGDSRGEPIETRKLKFDASGQSAGLERPGKPPWQARIIDEAPGRWVVTYSHRPGHAPRGVETEHAIQFFGLDKPLTVLACFDADGSLIEWQCDAALPAIRGGGMIEYVDLDLDVMVNPDGTHFVRDLEEFEERSVSLNYSEEAKAAAWKGVALALLLLKRKRYPFDGSAERLLAEVLSR